MLLARQFEFCVLSEYLWRAYGFANTADKDHVVSAEVWAYRSRSMRSHIDVDLNYDHKSNAISKSPVVAGTHVSVSGDGSWRPAAAAQLEAQRRFGGRPAGHRPATAAESPATVRGSRPTGGAE